MRASEFVAWIVAALTTVAFVYVVVVVVGSDIDEPPPPHPSQQTVEHVVRAVGYYGRHGYSSTVEYFDGDGERPRRRYLIMLDRTGTVRFNPYTVELDGVTLATATTDTGEPLIDALLAAANNGGGWVSTHFANPRNDLVQRAHFYALAYDGTVFAGVYFD